jgi:sulfur-oxidizing protein SoxZ
MATLEPRIRLPEMVTKGETILVRALITHQMETGLRRDGDGNVIPRKIINLFLCRYNERVVFSAVLHEAVSANPYMEFHIVARDSGTLDFFWYEDGGAVYTASHDLVVN